MERVFIQEKNFSKIKNLINENSGKEIVFSSDSDDVNRQVLEKAKINILLLNVSEKRDRQKQRDSGFNHVLAKIAKKNNISIGINFDEVVFASGIAKARILGRIRQNIMLCNKNKVQMKFVLQNVKRDVYDLKSLGLVLGMPTWMVKNL